MAASLAAQQHTTEAPSVIDGPQPMKAQPALMNNDSVLKMHSAGLSASVNECAGSSD